MYYSFTLVKTQGNRKISEYRKYLSDLDARFSDEYSILNVVYEEDHGLHLHALIKSARRIGKKHVYLYKHGWSVRINKLDSMNDLGIWTHYCAKHYADHIDKKFELEEQHADYLLNQKDEVLRDGVPAVGRPDPSNDNARNDSEVSNAGSDSLSDSLILPMVEDLLPWTLSKRNFDIRNCV